MDGKKVYLELTSCKSCPHFKEGYRQSTDGFDSGNDWMCGKMDNRIIEPFVEWHEVNKVKIPEWCPLRVLNNKIK